MNSAQIEKVREMVGNGYGSARIAREVGATDKEVQRCTAEGGFVISPVVYDQSCERWMMDLYQDGASVANLAKKFTGFGKKNIDAAVEAAGLKRDSSDHGRRHAFNEKAFDVVTTEPQAYWMGVSVCRWNERCRTIPHDVRSIAEEGGTSS